MSKTSLKARITVEYFGRGDDRSYTDEYLPEIMPGDILPITEIAGRRVTVRLGDRLIDFGMSEIELVKPAILYKHA